MTLWTGSGNHPEIPNPKPVWRCHVPPAFFPLERAWRGAPNSLEFLVAVAWSFQPGNERREGYFIQRRRSKIWPWALLAYDYDDNWGVWSWKVRAAGDSAYPTHAVAGRALLESSWAWECKTWQTGLFDEVELAGLIDEEAAWTIGKTTLRPS